MSNTYEAIGKLISRSNEVQVTDKFKKREFVIEIEDGAYTQAIKFQLTQNNCDKISKFKRDDKIKVTFNLRGKGYEKDGKTVYFTNLEAWKVEAESELMQPVQTIPLPPPAQATSMPEPSSNGGVDDQLPF